MALWDLVTIKRKKSLVIAINLDFGNAEKRQLPYNQMNKVCTEGPSVGELAHGIRDVYCALASNHLCNLIPITSYAMTFESTRVTWEMSSVQSLYFEQACDLLAEKNTFLFAMNFPRCDFNNFIWFIKSGQQYFYFQK